MNWTITETKDIDLCHALRRSVFIEEQNVNEADEVDGLDCDALHFSKGKRPTSWNCEIIIFGKYCEDWPCLCVEKDAWKGTGFCDYSILLGSRRGPKKC